MMDGHQPQPSHTTFTYFTANVDQATCFTANVTTCSNMTLVSSEFCRYFIMYHHGGVYADLDMEWAWGPLRTALVDLAPRVIRLVLHSES